MRPFFILAFLLCFSFSKGAPPSTPEGSTPPEQLKWLIKESQDIYAKDGELAYSYLEDAHLIAQKENDSTSLLQILQLQSRLLMLKGFSDEALKLVYEAKELATHLGDSVILAQLMYTESSVYHQFQEFEKSIANSQEVQKLFQHRPQSLEYAWALNCLGEAFRLQGHYQEAQSYYLDARQVFLKNQSEPQADRYAGLIAIENNLAYLFYAQGDLQNAQTHLDSFKIHLAVSPRVPVMLEGNYCQVNILNDLGKRRQAIELALEMVSIAQEHVVPKYELQYVKWIRDYYRAQGQTEKALEYADRVHELNSTIEDEKAQFRMHLHQQELEKVTLENENQALLARQEAQYWINATLIVILVVVSLSAVLVFRNNRKIRNLNRLLNQQNDRLDAANREINGLIGIVAHDLKAPLNKSVMLADMLAGQLGDHPSAPKITGMIKKTCQDGEHLIQDLLEINSLESGRQEVQWESIQVSELIVEVTDSFRAKAAKKGIDLHVDPGPLETSMASDPRLLKRILDNLISNALKFTHSGKSVYVTCSQSKDVVYLKIRDEGPGISPEDQKKLFGRFQRLTARPTGGESSHGLGMSIVKTLTERLGIDLKLDSQLGEGTEFQLCIPKHQNKIPGDSG